MRNLTLAFVAPVLLASVGCTFSGSAKFDQRWRNEIAPDFELTALDGKRVSLVEHRGKPVLLTFWGMG